MFPLQTVFPILDALDPNGYIMYRLVRDATHFVDGHHVKDLSCLNRDLKKVIVVDWNPDSVKFHKSNTILVPRWKGNDDDLMLVDLAAFLRSKHINYKLSFIILHFLSCLLSLFCYHLYCHLKISC